MARDLQAVTDSLGSRLKRAVAIEDSQMHLLTYNSYHGRMDQVRMHSILHRTGPVGVNRWVLRLGIQDATGPIHVPANPELGMDARLCCPIRAQGHLFGYVWIVEDPPLDHEEIALVEAVAQDAGEILHRERLLGELERGRERELLRDLLSNQPQVRQHAANEMVESRLLSPMQSVAVLVVVPLPPVGTLNDAALVSTGLALDQVRRMVSSRYSLQLVRPDHGLLLVGTEAPSLRSGGISKLGSQVLEATMEQFRKDLGWTAIVGMGDVQPRLEDAFVSYEQARQTARVAHIIPTFRPVATWAELGIYRMLLQFPIEGLTSGALHPGLVDLMRSPDSAVLVRTLETYLDSGCDAKATSTDLRLHRTSLYYRLDRIERITGTDLRNGNHRLALHLGLKLARLAGISSGANASILTS